MANGVSRSWKVSNDMSSPQSSDLEHLEGLSRPLTCCHILWTSQNYHDLS